MGSMITFARPDGKKSKAYLAAAGRGRPGIVVIQEWWGLNDQICGVADRFARAGYNALAPDLYKGSVTDARDEAQHLMDGLDYAEATHQDLRGAAVHLKETSGKIAALGFCLGGALTIAAVVHVPEFAAGISYYGIAPAEAADPSRIRVPVQGHFSLTDTWCTPAAVDALEGTLKRIGAKYEFHRYSADHAFFNEQDEHYDVASANQAWERTLAFLKATL